MARIKKADKNRSVSSRELSDHLVGEAILTEREAPVDIAGFNGAQDLEWQAKQGEVHSDVKLEDDQGQGKGVIIRSFDFKANPEVFRHAVPSKQELFNSHAREIEGILFADGLEVMRDVSPQLKISKDKSFYRIVVGAEARKGQYFDEKPKTLSQIANG